MIWREQDRERADLAAKTRHDKHRSRNLARGFGGKGAPIVEQDRAVAALSREAVDLQNAYVRRYAYAYSFWKSLRWRVGDWCHDRFVLTERGMIRLAEASLTAWRLTFALLAGWGCKEVGSRDAPWILVARSQFADHEIGHIIAAADYLGPGTHDKAAVAKAIAATSPASLDDPETQRTVADFLRAAGASRVADRGEVARTEGISRERVRQTERATFAKVIKASERRGTEDSLARISAKRWQALRTRGFGDPRR